jgi:hypothetical protein
MAILFSLCFITAVSIFIPVYLLDSVWYVSYSLDFLFAVEETLCCGDKGIVASIHISKKAPEIVQVYVKKYTVQDNYCRQELV